MRFVRRFAVAVLGVVALVATALFIGAVPTGGKGAKATTNGSVRIYVLSNGFHSDIAIPHNDGINLGRLGFDQGDYPVEPSQVHYWAIGWGSLTAYTSLMAVSDLTLGIAAKALAFDNAVIHVTPMGKLEPSERVFALDLTAAEFNELLANIRTWISNMAPLAVTQGFGDRFYAGEGSFAPWYSCNTWTGRRLREIGVNVGLWTPISQSLEFGLRRIGQQ